MAISPATKARDILVKTAANLEAVHTKAANDAGLAAKTAILDELDKVTSGRRLRGVGKKGAKLGVGYEVTTLGKGARVTVRARGPWAIIESDHKAYDIRPRGKGKKRKRALSFGGQAFSRVHHKATSGKKPWEKGEKAAGPKVDEILDQRYIKAALDAW